MALIFGLAFILLSVLVDLVCVQASLGCITNQHHVVWCYAMLHVTVRHRFARHSIAQHGKHGMMPSIIASTRYAAYIRQLGHDGVEYRIHSMQ